MKTRGDDLSHGTRVLLVLFVYATVVGASFLCVILEVGIPGEILEAVCLTPLVDGA